MRIRQQDSYASNATESADGPPDTSPHWQGTGAAHGGYASNKMDEEMDEGANSEDEHLSHCPAGINDAAQLALLERRFEDLLWRQRGLRIRRTEPDGSCLFRSISDQVYGDQDAHADIRERCMDFMASQPTHFAPFVTEDYASYIARKRRPETFGNHLEIQCMAELFNRPVEVFAYSADPINIFQSQYQTDLPPMRLSYHGGNHYNSLIDPFLPTVGTGLGLPAYNPASIDQAILQATAKDVDAEVVEAAMVAEAKATSELDRAQEEIERAIIAESAELYWKQQAKGGASGAGTSNMG